MCVDSVSGSPPEGRKTCAEYGLVVEEIDSVTVGVVGDIATDSRSAGARVLQQAARELLAERLADLAGDGARLSVAIDAGPPVAVRAVTKASQAG